MRKLTNGLLYLALALLAADLLAQTPTPTPGQRIQCTDTGWYQRACDYNWNFAIPGNLTGHTFQGCSAHTLYIYDENGATYAILDQCPVCTGTQGTYPKPDHPGVALTLWNHYYIDPGAEAARSTFGYHNDSFQIPPGVTHYTFIPLSQVQPPGQRAALAAAYGCTLGTPTATLTPTHSGPTPTPTANPYAQYIEALARAKVTGGCGAGAFCPSLTLTREQAAVWLVKASQAGPMLLLPCQTPPAFNDVRCDAAVTAKVAP